MYDDVGSLRRRISSVEYDLNSELARLRRQLESKIETLGEAAYTSVDYEQFRMEIDELVRRQNRFFRAFARELRKLNGQNKEPK